MTTFNQLIDQVALKLAGYSMRQDAMTHLATGIDSDDLSIVLGSVTDAGQGLIEIDDELMYVTGVDRPSATLTVAPWGRGYAGTTAVSHAANARVTIMPSYPRAEIKNAINETILAVFPKVYGVASTTFTYSPVQTTYQIPAAVQKVLSVTFEKTGPSKEWMPIRKWDVDRMANTGEFNSGVTLTLSQPAEAGSTVNVFYSKEPTVMSSGSDVFETVTGLPSSAKDLIVLGAVYRLLTMVEPGRATFASPEADYQQNRINYGQVTNVARTIYALFQQRLDEEGKKLDNKYGIRVHYTR